MKKVMVIGLVFLFLMLIFSGCNEQKKDASLDEKDKLLGTWKKNSTSMTFSSDGTGSYGSYPMSWKIKDGNLVLDIGQMMRGSYNFSFSDDGDKLFLDDGKGEVETWIRQ
ncbi:MAG: DUF5640 domain-containing protein [Candidatus Thermoplasmatota archaeon]